MVRIRDVVWVLAAAATLAGTRPAAADPIAFTGNAATDFSNAPGSESVSLVASSGPNAVGVQQTVPNALPSGAEMQNLWFNYNAATDTMYVGVQGFTNANGHEILGDISGNPNPALDPPNMPTLPAISSATNTWLGVEKSLAIAFAPAVTNAAGQTVAGTPTIIAGIPAGKGATTTPDFMVANYSAPSPGTTNEPQLLPNSFGTAIANGGSLAFNTTAATPDFEFTINNFSKVTGISAAALASNSAQFFIEGFNGMAGGSAGKTEFQWTQVPQPQGLNTPEPTTWLAWRSWPAARGGATAAAPLPRPVDRSSLE